MVFLHLHVRIWGWGVHSVACVVMSRDNLQGSVLSFYLVSLRNQTQVIGLADKSLYPLSRLTGPHRVLNSKVAGTGGPEWRAACRTAALHDVECKGEPGANPSADLRSALTCAVPGPAQCPDSGVRYSATLSTDHPQPPEWWEDGGVCLQQTSLRRTPGRASGSTMHRGLRPLR